MPSIDLLTFIDRPNNLFDLENLLTSSGLGLYTHERIDNASQDIRLRHRHNELYNEEEAVLKAEEAKGETNLGEEYHWIHVKYPLREIIVQLSVPVDSNKQHWAYKVIPELKTSLPRDKFTPWSAFEQASIMKYHIRDIAGATKKGWWYSNVSYPLSIRKCRRLEFAKRLLTFLCFQPFQHYVFAEYNGKYYPLCFSNPEIESFDNLTKRKSIKPIDAMLRAMVPKP